MKLINILRFLRGYVKFTVEGGFTERFINLCAANNIHIWSLQPQIGKIEGRVLVRNFAALRSIVRKSGVKLRITEKIGLPFFLKKHKSRAVLMFGIIFFLTFIMFMNRFVWLIEVTGTETVNHEEIINVLEQYGLKIGAYSPKLDELYVGRNGVNHFNGRLMWMSVNISGSKAVIEVRDYIDEHEDTTFGEPCNIVADFDGTILSIETFNGDKAVKAGNAVKKGDLLISGVIQNRDMSAEYLDARGKITALHQINYNKTYNVITTDYKSFCDVKEYTVLNILGAELPPYISPSINSFNFSRYLTVNDTVLPFGLSKKTAFSTKDKSSESLLLLFSLDDYLKNYYYNFRNTNVISSEMCVNKYNDAYNINTNLNCIDFMGIKSKIYIDKENFIDF